MFTIWDMLFTLLAGFNLRHGIQLVLEANVYGWFWNTLALVWIAIVATKYCLQ